MYRHEEIKIHRDEDRGAAQGVFLAVKPGESLEVGDTTASSFHYLLQLLRESLFDGATVEAAQAMAEGVAVNGLKGHS